MAGELKVRLIAELDKILKAGTEKLVIKDERGRLVVLPENAAEVAAAVRAARAAGACPVPEDYYFGPTWPEKEEEKTLPQVAISLARLRNIRHFDRTALCLQVEPAMELETVANWAQASGYYFPGQHCAYRHLTVGQGVLKCLSGETVAFGCLTACLCGIELVSLREGERMVVGGNCLRDLCNFNLAYMLADVRHQPAVITGIMLKIFPPASVTRIISAEVAGWAEAAATATRLMADDLLQEIIFLRRSGISEVDELLTELIDPAEEREGSNWPLVMIALLTGPTPAIIDDYCRRWQEQSSQGLTSPAVFTDHYYQESLLSLVEDYFARLPVYGELCLREQSSWQGSEEGGEDCNAAAGYRLLSVRWSRLQASWCLFYFRPRITR